MPSEEQKKKTQSTTTGNTARRAIAQNDDERGVTTYEYEEVIHNGFYAPEVLRAYEEIVPGSAAETFENFKAEQKHRQKLEAFAVYSTGVIGVLTAVTAVVLAATGHEIGAGLVGGGTLGGALIGKARKK